MTKTEAIARIKAKLPALTAAQAEALAELADAFTRKPQAGDAATRKAIAEGLAQADSGAFVKASKIDTILRSTWR
jgi:predicted transcriptional regulator